jgi:hypothetical protein
MRLGGAIARDLGAFSIGRSPWRRSSCRNPKDGDDSPVTCCPGTLFDWLESASPFYGDAVGLLGSLPWSMVAVKLFEPSQDNAGLLIGVTTSDKMRLCETDADAEERCRGFSGWSSLVRSRSSLGC